VVITEPIDLSALQRFLRNPVEHFFARRLKVWFRDAELHSEDDESFALDGLQRFQLRQWLLERTLASGPEADWDAVLERESLRLDRRGSLPLAGFGEISRQALIEPLAEQLARYRQCTETWNRPVAEPLALVVNAPGIALHDWLSGLRTSSAVEGLMLLQLETGRLQDGNGKQKTLRWKRVLPALCRHLLACASGHAVQGCLIAEDANLLLQPVPAEQAQQILHGWLEAWLEGLQQPLPVVLETGMTWLLSEDLAQTRLQFEGNDFKIGALAGSVALQRSYPDFASLHAAGFEAWASVLYQPLTQMLENAWLTVQPVEAQA
jgi:exodeoxyribonuclease V gamma subunit